MTRSPHAHGFGAGGGTGVRFNPEVTFHNFSPDISSLAPNSPTLSLAQNSTPKHCPANVALGKTPILPEERSTSFSQWCNSRRKNALRMNDSDELRRKTPASMLGMSTSAVAVRASPGNLTNLDVRRPSMGSPSWTEGGSPGLGKWLLQAAAAPADRWWLDKTDGACDYCSRILSESGKRVLFGQARVRALAPPTSTLLPPEGPPALLLEQTAQGVRRWIGLHVVRHVIALINQVRADDAKGLLEPPAPAAATAAPAFGVVGAPPAFGGGGTFGAKAFGAPAANAQQQQQQQEEADEKAREEERKGLMRANAIERKQQVGPLCIHAWVTLMCP